mmetsp:Transcript_20459/g.56527  ORF Transcript_20459/g.56527 Transcript_20459/m.56527 type:complete len:193 (-) Transcript_20459:104-682(-)
MICDKMHKAFREANPLGCIAFNKQTIPRKYFLRYLEEVQWLDRHFGRRSQEYWQQEMNIHNRTVTKAGLMGLGERRLAKRMICTDIDDFILRFRVHDVVKALHCINRFGRRLAAKLQKQPSARLWTVSGAIMMTREGWILLCSKVENVLRIIPSSIRERKEISNITDQILDSFSVENLNYSSTTSHQMSTDY